MQRKLTWGDRAAYLIILLGLVAMIFGVDTAPHYGPELLDDPIEASR